MTILQCVTVGMSNMIKPIRLAIPLYKQIYITTYFGMPYNVGKRDLQGEKSFIHIRLSLKIISLKNIK